MEKPIRGIFPGATEGYRGGTWENLENGLPKKAGDYTCKIPLLNMWPENEAASLGEKDLLIVGY